MKKFSKIMSCVIIIIGFFVVLYWVEFSSWSSREVSQFNEGYGTFDMKNYNAEIVEKVLSTMEPEGYNLSYGYYIGDYLLVIIGLFTRVIIKYTDGKSAKK